MYQYHRIDGSYRSKQAHLLTMTNNTAAYCCILTDFMKYIDDVDYSDDHVFTPHDLGAVTAKDLVEYFNFRAYGTPTPS